MPAPVGLGAGRARVGQAQHARRREAGCPSFCGGQGSQRPVSRIAPYADHRLWPQQVQHRQEGRIADCLELEEEVGRISFSRLSGMPH